MADNSTTTEGASTGFVFYHYDPSMVAATVFIIVFGISGILHIWQLCWRRTWYFIPFVIGCVCKLSPMMLPLLWDTSTNVI